MYKIFSKNLDDVKVGDILVDFGDIPEFDECLNEDQTALTRIPIYRERPYCGIINSVFIENGVKKFTLKWEGGPVDQELTLSKSVAKAGWDRVAIFDEKGLLVLRIKGIATVDGYQGK
jgi:hypothetical protein